MRAPCTAEMPTPPNPMTTAGGAPLDGRGVEGGTHPGLHRAADQAGDLQRDVVVEGGPRPRPGPRSAPRTRRSPGRGAPAGPRRDSGDVASGRVPATKLMACGQRLGLLAGAAVAVPARRQRREHHLVALADVAHPRRRPRPPRRQPRGPARPGTCSRPRRRSGRCGRRRCGLTATHTSPARGSARSRSSTTSRADPGLRPAGRLSQGVTLPSAPGPVPTFELAAHSALSGTLRCQFPTSS